MIGIVSKRKRKNDELGPSLSRYHLLILIFASLLAGFLFARQQIHMTQIAPSEIDFKEQLMHWYANEFTQDYQMEVSVKMGAIERHLWLEVAGGEVVKVNQVEADGSQTSTDLSVGYPFTIDQLYQWLLTYNGSADVAEVTFTSWGLPTNFRLATCDSEAVCHQGFTIYNFQPTQPS